MPRINSVELFAVSWIRHERGSYQSPHERLGDWHHDFPCLEKPIGKHITARPGATPRPHARHDIRPRHERRHHILESRCGGTIRMEKGAGAWQGLSSTHADRLSRAA